MNKTQFLNAMLRILTFLIAILSMMGALFLARFLGFITSDMTYTEKAITVSLISYLILGDKNFLSDQLSHLINNLKSHSNGFKPPKE